MSIDNQEGKYTGVFVWLSVCVVGMLGIHLDIEYSGWVLLFGCVGLFGEQ